MEKRTPIWHPATSWCDKKQANNMLNASMITIREFAQLIGKLAAAEPGVEYAALYYKTLELDRDFALKTNQGNFDQFMCILQESKQCLGGGYIILKTLINLSP